MFQNGCSAEQGENLAPCFGLQFFGHVAIDGATEVMTVTLKDVDDRELWSTRDRAEASAAGRGAAGAAAASDYCRRLGGVCDRNMTVMMAA